MDDLTLKEKLELSSTVQKSRYEKFLKEFDGVELTDKEKGYLLWLAGWGKEAAEVYTGLFKKIRNK